MRKRKYESQGETETPEYHAWVQMKIRCTGPGAPPLHEPWRTDYTAFLAALNRRPSPSHTLQRAPDPEGPYAPGNVTWQSSEERRAARAGQPVVPYTLRLPETVVDHYRARAQALGVPIQQLMREVLQQPILASPVKKGGAAGVAASPRPQESTGQEKTEFQVTIPEGSRYRPPSLPMHPVFGPGPLGELRRKLAAAIKELSEAQKGTNQILIDNCQSDVDDLRDALADAENDGGF